VAARLKFFCHNNVAVQRKKSYIYEKVMSVKFLNLD